MSPFRPPFPPQSDVYPKAQYCLSSLPTTQHSRDNSFIFPTIRIARVSFRFNASPPLCLSVSVQAPSFHQLSALYLTHSSLAIPLYLHQLLRLGVSVSLWQTPCFQYFAASWTSPKKSTPLQSSKSSLFLQNTRGGGAAKIASLESTISRLFFPPLFATQLSPRGCRPPRHSPLSLLPWTP